MSQNLVIVESPAKAKTIEKYMGPGYTVLASFGHVRDLVNKDGSVRPEDDFAMKWQPGERSGKHISAIKQAMKKADALYLATDPDREGEAISWHVTEILDDAKLLANKDVHRVTFNEITKRAVQDAFAGARELDTPLIEAYLARRALDYLVGFTLSPVLWRKLPGSRSAGRVQSVALRLICERETEIEAFKPQEYWSIDSLLHNPDGAPFTARLTHLAGNKLAKLDIGTEDDANHAVQRIQNKNLSIQTIEKKQVRRNPSPPFITSTLQQEAARKLYFSASQTMQMAQRLYEGVEINGETTGLITYMRTDGTTLSGDAVAECRSVIQTRYGDKYLPDAPRLYKSKAKNAQEAHEAIRPTSLSRTPEEVRKILSDDRQADLYELIWKRTMASQMENAVLDQMAVDISDGTDDVILRANGSVVTFDGFLTLYQEGKDDTEDDADASDKDRRLPPLKEGDALKTVTVTPHQHFTQPPPRYSEASLVKKLEELGIGRPSTYASIIQVLKDREYVTVDRRRFTAADRGRIVTAFLMKFFERYVDYDFTANLEEELDAIAAGHVSWKEMLRLFWTDFEGAIGETKDLKISDVIDHLNETLGSHLFGTREDGSDPRSCPACKDGRLSLKLGKYGAFIGCSAYPECKYTRPLVLPEGADESDAAQVNNEPKVLGEHPETGRTISLRRGPYGPYVQMEPPEAPEPEEKEDKPKKGKKKAAPKPKRQGLPAGTDPETVGLEAAVALLALPREVGSHPDGKIIKAGIGRFGPYLLHDGKYTSIPKDDDLMTIELDRALVVMTEAAERKAKRGAGKGKAAGKKKAPAKKASAKKK